MHDDDEDRDAAAAAVAVAGGGGGGGASPLPPRPATAPHGGTGSKSNINSSTSTTPPAMPRSLSFILGRKAPANPQADAAEQPPPQRQRTATNTSIFKRSTFVDRLFRRTPKQNSHPLIHSTSHPNLGFTSTSRKPSTSSLGDAAAVAAAISSQQTQQSQAATSSVPDVTFTTGSQESVNDQLHTHDSGFTNSGGAAAIPAGLAAANGSSSTANSLQKSTSPEPVDPADPRLETDAEFVATLLFENRHPHIPKTQFSLILAKSAEFNKRVLAAYMSHFTFDTLTLDAAFRELCGHLYLTGETQAIDRILAEFAKKYYEDTPEKSIWLSQDIVYATLFSIVLLNTDLYMTNSEQVKTMKKMSRREFTNNTFKLVDELRSELERECGPFDKSETRRWRKEFLKRLEYLYGSIKNNRILQRQVSRDLVSSESKDNLAVSHNAADLRSKIMYSSGSRPGSTQQQESGSAFQSKLSSTPSSSSIIIEVNAEGNIPKPGDSQGGDQLKSLITAITKNPNKNWGKAHLAGIGHALNAHKRSGSSLPVLNPEGFRVQYPSKPLIFSSQISRKLKYEKAGAKSRDKRWCVCDAFLCLDSERGVEMMCFSEDKKENISLGLLHAFAEALPLPGYKDTREHVFSLRLNTGGMFLFDATSAELVAQWVREINYYAAIRSKEPLRGGVSNAEYGWGSVVRELADKELDEALRTTRVVEWLVPGGGMIVSPLGVKDQLASMRRQVAFIQGEIREHEQAKVLIETKLASKPSAYKIASANWQRKFEYLDRELQKYTTYVTCIEERHPASVHTSSAPGTGGRVSVVSNTSLLRGEPSEKSYLSGVNSNVNNAVGGVTTHSGTVVAAPYGTHLAPGDAVGAGHATPRRTSVDVKRDVESLYSGGSEGAAKSPRPLSPANGTGNVSADSASDNFLLAASRIDIAASRGVIPDPSNDEVFLTATSEFSVNQLVDEKTRARVVAAGDGANVGNGSPEFHSPESSRAASFISAAAENHTGHARETS